MATTGSPTNTVSHMEDSGRPRPSSGSKPRSNDAAARRRGLGAPRSCLERVGSAADRDHLRAAVREHRSNVAGVGVVIDEPDAKAVARRLRLERLTVRIERSWFGYRTTCDTPSVPVCRAVALRTRALA